MTIISYATNKTAGAEWEVKYLKTHTPTPARIAIAFTEYPAFVLLTHDPNYNRGRSTALHNALPKRLALQIFFRILFHGPNINFS